MHWRAQTRQRSSAGAVGCSAASDEVLDARLNEGIELSVGIRAGASIRAECQTEKPEYTGADSRVAHGIFATASATLRAQHGHQRISVVGELGDLGLENAHGRRR